ncbi:protein VERNALIZATION 3-like isoform X2 [Carex rostrata]
MQRERDSLVVGRVVGDVLDPFERKVQLRVTYSSRNVTNGYEFKPSAVVEQPIVEVMVNPDAPSPSDPTLREYLHWLVTDIPGTAGATHGKSYNNNSMIMISHLAYMISLFFHFFSLLGHEVVSYESPRPSLGIHRFVFVLFQQQGSQTIYAPGWRQNFCTRDFAELYNLGPPVAAVFFNCQRESGSGGRRMPM